MMWLFQERLMYPVNVDRQSNARFDAPAPYVDFPVTTKDGIELMGWYTPAKPGMPTIVYFHGNADHLVKLPDYHDTIVAQGFGVLLTSYRGYSGNKGMPNEQGLYTDADAFVTALLKTGVAQKDIILYGFSLGTGVALEMAVKHPPRAVVLGAPFFNMTQAASYRYGWLPVHYLLRNRYENAQKIAQIDAPILIVNGAQDSVFPASQGEELSKLSKQATYKMLQGDHVDFFFDHGGKAFIANWLKDHAS